MSTPKDYANPTARAELRRLHEADRVSHIEAARIPPITGAFSEDGYGAQSAFLVRVRFAIPHLLDGLDKRDELLRRCSNFIAGQAHGHHSRVAHLCEAPHRWQDCPTFMDVEKGLLADIAAAGFTPEGK